MMTFLQQFVDLNREKEDEFEELLDLAENGSIFYRACWMLAQFLIPFYTKLPDWKRKLLEQEPDKRYRPDEWIINGYAIKFYRPYFFDIKRTRETERIAPTIPCTKWAYFVWFFLTYAACKMVSMATVYIAFTQECKAWKPDISKLSKGNYTQTCLLPANLSAKDKRRLTKISYLGEILSQLGSPVRTVNDLMPYSFMMMTIAYIVFVFYACRYPNEPNFRLNQLLFHYNPMAERNRLKSRMNDLLMGILEDHNGIKAHSDAAADDDLNDSSDYSDNDEHIYGEILQFKEIDGVQNVYQFNRNNIFVSSFYERYKQTFYMAKNNQDLKSHYNKRPINRLVFEEFTNWFRKLFIRQIPSEIHLQEYEDQSNKSFKSMAKQQVNQKINADVNDNETFPCYLENNQLPLVPAHLTLASYKRQIGCEFYMIALFVLGSSLLASSIATGFFYRELKQRIEQRYEQIHCRLWHPLAIPRLNLITIEELHKQDYVAIYLAYEIDPTQWTQFFQVIQIEAMQMFEWPRVLFTYELLFNLMCIASWLGIYMLFVFLNYLSQRTWADQIINQLKLINSQMSLIYNKRQEIYQAKKLNHKRKKRTTTTTDSSNSKRRLCIVRGAPSDRIDNHQSKLMKLNEKSSLKNDLSDIEKALGITYLNFMLFKKELRYHKPFFKFVFIQLTLIVGLAAIFAFWSESIWTGRTRLIIKVIRICAIILLNQIAQLGVSFTDKIQHLFAQINLIMAKSTQISMQKKLILKLWRRQVMSATEIERTFGISILGTQLSSSTIIQANSYILAAWLYSSRGR